MKKLLVILLSALSLTAFAEKKTISIQQPKCENAMVANLVSGTLMHAFLQSEKWQVVERPSNDELNRRYLAGEPINWPTAQYTVITEINDRMGMCYISCRIIDIETVAIVAIASEMAEPSSQSIKDTCNAIAKRLIEEQLQ